MAMMILSASVGRLIFFYTSRMCSERGSQRIFKSCINLLNLVCQSAPKKPKDPFSCRVQIPLPPVTPKSDLDTCWWHIMTPHKTTFELGMILVYCCLFLSLSKKCSQFRKKLPPFVLISILINWPHICTSRMGHSLSVCTQMKYWLLNTCH